MKNNSKRGFTIVELIIVIAVIGILAAVLIPTFSELIKQAQTANDTVLVTNLNKALALDPTATYDTMHEALTSVRENGGYDVAKINATNNDNEILWDSVNKCFVYKDGGEIKYIPDTQKTVIAKNEEYKFWQICNENNPIPEASEQTYSVYWSGSNRNDVTVSVGFDAGDAVVSVVNYNGATENSGRTVDIRTNGGTLNVNAKADTVNHYMSVDSVSITAVGTYNEYGKVTKAALKVESGKVEVKDGAFVNKIALPKETSKQAEIDIGSNAIVRVVEGNGEYVKSNPNGVVAVTDEQKATVTTKINNTLLDIYKVRNIVDQGNYSESEYLKALGEKKTELKDFNLYYETSYSATNIKNVEVDGLTYASEDSQVYSMGNGALLSAKVFKVENGKLCINKITYISALARKQVLKVNGKIVSLVEDAYDVDLDNELTIKNVVLSNGDASPVSSNEFNLVYKEGKAGRIAITVEGVNKGDIVVIYKNRNDKVSYSYDAYNENDFGVYVYAYDSELKVGEPSIRQIATYVVFDGTTGAYKGTFTIVLNCSVGSGK